MGSYGNQSSPSNLKILVIANAESIAKKKHSLCSNRREPKVVSEGFCGTEFGAQPSGVSI